MKQLFYLWTPILFFLLMFLFPQPVFQGAKDGLLLWFNTVLPTLLPFLIISNLLINTQAVHAVSRGAGFFLRPFLRVSDYGAYTVLAGFFCGYPMGGKTASDLIRSGRITKAEGAYLLSFCNNTSPMFVVSFVAAQNLKRPALALPALGILWISAIACSFLFRRNLARKVYLRERHSSDVLCPALTSSDGDRTDHNASRQSSLLDNCIMDGFEAITKIGGYIMLFSICIELFGLLPFHDAPFFQMILSSLEITNGIVLISDTGFSFPAKFILCMSLASFGGWCSVAQTQCMIQKSGLSISSYIVQKLVTMLVTSLIAFFYLLLFPLGS